MNQMKLYRCLKLLESLKTNPRHMPTITRYLNVTERTVYRYFDLFKQLGYQVNKDKFNKYYLTK